MKRMYEFKCCGGHITERFCSFEDKQTTCSECNLPASRIISAPSVALEGISGSFPGAAMKWERKHTEHLRKKTT
jgi:predicted nucleic acid-binding Zn ribbon protein